MTRQDAVLGITLISVLFATLSLGIATVQITIWVKTNSPIKYLNKFTILFLWFTLLLHTIMAMHLVYFYLITTQGVPLEQIPLPWSYSGCSTLDLLVAILTQVLYSIRLWQLSTYNRYRPVIFSVLGAMIFIEFGFGIYIPTQISQTPDLPDILHAKFSWAVIADFSLSSAIDISLCLLLIYFLANAGRKFDWVQTNWTVFLAYVSNTGAPACLCSVASAITYGVMPDNLIFFALRVVLTGLYVNSFMAMLNARYYFQTTDGLVPITLPHGSIYLYGPRVPQNHFPLAGATSRNRNDTTINEAGLPLFESKDSTNPLGEIHKLEVKVTTEQENI